MNRRGGTALTVVWEVGPARALPTRSPVLAVAVAASRLRPPPSPFPGVGKSNLELATLAQRSRRAKRTNDLAVSGKLPYTTEMGVKKKLDSKSERLEARVTPEFKDQLMLACNLSGKSVTDFIVEHLGQAAQEVITEHSQWRLTRQDSEAFAEALLNPKPPGQRLIQAAQRYRKTMGL